MCLKLKMINLMWLLPYENWYCLAEMKTELEELREKRNVFVNCVNFKRSLYLCEESHQLLHNLYALIAKK